MMWHYNLYISSLTGDGLNESCTFDNKTAKRKQNNKYKK